MYFATSSLNKFQEAQLIIADLEQLEIDLPEIQEVDPYKIIEEKLKIAFKTTKVPIIVEDTSFSITGMNGLPGPLIKWFLKTIGNEGVVKLAENFGTGAVAKTIIGYTENGTAFHFFEGEVAGKVVNIRGDKGFGWDPIFEVLAVGKTFAEMDIAEKSSYSMRKVAFQKLKDFLEENQN